MNNSQDLISCLCVTRKRPEFLLRAIESFKSQTYPKKELVIIYEDDDDETIRIAEQIKDEEIKLFKISANPKLSLGALRNISIDKSEGKYLCQWDDDDWYHCERLEVQLNAIKQSYKKASVLVYWIIYDGSKGMTYFSFPNPWPGSIMCEREFLVSEKYPDLTQGEDMEPLIKLSSTGSICPIVRPDLYIYSFHGKNTYDYDHFSSIFVISQELSKSASNLIESILESKYSNLEASNLLSGFKFMNELSYMHTMIPGLENNVNETVEKVS